MKSLEQLREEKEIIRESIKQGQSGKIVGVAVDPFKPELIIIHSGDRPTAENRLRYILDQDLFADQELFVNITFQRRRFGKFPLAEIDPRSDALKRDLIPGQEIKPDGGDRGRVGCFVSLSDGREAVLTAGHIFHQRTPHLVCYRDRYDPQDCTIIGNFGFAAGPAKLNTNLVDCAVFFPTKNITLANRPDINTVIDRLQISSMAGNYVKRLGGPFEGEGQVLDEDAIIKYEAFIEDDWYEVVLDAQVCVKNADNKKFGALGDSGSPVIISKENGHISTGGALLGLYTAVGTHESHFVSPIHECMKAVRANGLLHDRS